VVAFGAGAEMRHAMGVAVFSGMLGVTFFGLLLTPVFYVVVRGLVHKRAQAATARPSDYEPLVGHPGSYAAPGEGGANA
jgi:hypothetical protein